MAVEVVWLGRAQQRLREIVDYYRKVAGRRTARKMRDKIYNRAEILSTHPLAGQREELLSGYDGDYRYLVEGNYKIIYRVVSDRAVITTVFDCRQNPERMPEEV